MKKQLFEPYQSQHIYALANATRDKVLGVGVIVVRDGKILLGKRKGAHGAGTWSIPGGKMEFSSKYGGVPKWERPEEAAIRELLEETGLNARRLTVIGVHDHHWEELKQTHLSIFVVAEVDPGNPVVMEPDKCECWEFFELHELPQPLFPPVQWLLQESGYTRSQPSAFPLLTLH